MKKMNAFVPAALAMCVAAGTCMAGPSPIPPSRTHTKSMGPVKPYPRADVARKPIASMATPVQNTPSRVAGIKRMPDGTYQLTTPWMPYSGAGTDAQDALVYDSEQVDDTGFPIGGSDCGEGSGQRYLLSYTPGANDYQNPYTTWNMSIDKAYNGAESGRCDFLWYWTGTGNDYYIAVFTSEDVSMDCSLPSENNVNAGVVFSGWSNINTGFFYTDADVSGNGLFWPLPADGLGGIVMIMADAYDGQTFTLAAGPTQPGIWFTSNIGGLPGRPGVSEDPTWADVNSDGDHTDECFTYTGLGLCHEPGINAMAFWSEPAGPGCYPDCDGDGELTFFDFLCYTNAFNANDAYADCDNDGELTFFDFLCYTNLFNAGC